MNAQDKREFDAMWKSNQKFDDLYVEFQVRAVFPIQRWGAVCADPLAAKDLKDGKTSKIMAFTKKRDEDKRARLLELTALMRQAENYARRLSAFFPEARRWHWQEVFFNIALNGTGTVSQRQGGGRREGTRPFKTRADYNRIINYRYSPRWIHRTDDEFLEEHPHISGSKLARAKKWDAKREK